ncbi:MAG TPA: hypothetical protein VFV73_23670 [Streptosporangiaceae bacterium]|nr:hypothetical protein [Streptosporangiaceae bacterium]
MPDSAPPIGATYGTDPGSTTQILATVQRRLPHRGHDLPRRVDQAAGGRELRAGRLLQRRRRHQGPPDDDRDRRPPAGAEPKAVWIALWDNAADLDGTPYVTSAVWPNASRAKQYQGNMTVKVGGISLQIDADMVAGPVVRK